MSKGITPSSRLIYATTPRDANDEGHDEQDEADPGPGGRDARHDGDSHGEDGSGQEEPPRH